MSHRVNGIRIQTNVYGPKLPQERLPDVVNGQRSINIKLEDESPAYVVRQRVGLCPLPTSFTIIDMTNEAERLAHLKNSIGIVARAADMFK